MEVDWVRFDLGDSFDTRHYRQMTRAVARLRRRQSRIVWFYLDPIYHVAGLWIIPRASDSCGGN
jgi:hypothetical protein